MERALLSVIGALARSPLTHAMNASVWAFAVIEMAHLLALAVLGGAMIVACLRAMTVWLKSVETADLLRALSPIVVIALAVTVVSGGLLFSSAPLKYFFNIAFRSKMLALATALLSYAALYRLAARPPPALPAFVQPALAALTLALWLAVGVSGRLIGLI